MNANPDLEKAIAEDKKALAFNRSPVGRRIPYFVAPGSFLSRGLMDYRTILHHNGAPDVFAHIAQNYSSNDTALVDSGSGSGLALSQLRKYLPHTRLVAIDIIHRDQFFIDNRGDIIPAEYVQQTKGVYFLHDSFLNINELLPEGFDGLVSVGGFPDDQDPLAYRLLILQKYWEGLRVNGIAQMVAQFRNVANVDELMKELERLSFIARFTTGNETVMRSNALVGSSVTVAGTLTLGPKPDR